MLKPKIKNFLLKNCFISDEIEAALAADEIIKIISSNIQSGRKKWEKKHTAKWWSNRMKAVRKCGVK